MLSLNPKQKDMTTANVILNQLGGGKFIIMTGATCFYDGPNTLIVKFKGSKVANHVNITLNSMDTYDVRFAKISGVNYTKVKEVYGAYSDMLTNLFETVTGLRTSL